MHDQSFPKSRRLLKNAEYQKVYAQGHKKSFGGIVLHWLEVGEGQSTRFGLALRRKIGNAVLRNRIKRRLRYLIRTCPQPFARGYWVIITAATRNCATEDIEAQKKYLYHALEEIVRK